MKKLITTLALVSSLAVAGIASAQSTVPSDTSSGTGTTYNSDTSASGTSAMPSATESGAATGATTGSTGTTDMTGTSSGTSGGSSTVGVPNTGAGGDATTNVGLLMITAAIAIVAGVYALRRNKTL